MGHENPAERAEGLTDEQRLHLAQAANLLQEYGAECSRSGTDSTAEGCNASAYVLRQMLAETARIERESRASAGPDALQRVRDYVMGRKGIQSKFGGQTYTYVMREDVIDAIDDAARGIGVRSTETREGLGPEGVEPGPEVAPDILKCDRSCMRTGRCSGACTSGEAPTSAPAPAPTVEVAIALEQQRALSIVAAVEKHGAEIDPDAMSPHWCGWGAACEEIAERLRTEEWALNGVPAPLPAGEAHDALRRYLHWTQCHGSATERVVAQTASRLLDSNDAATPQAAPAPAEPVAYRNKAPQDAAKDHEIAQAVNAIRDAAITYRDAQQLRERIAGIVVPLLKRPA
jgi:hypothetical protein